MYRIYVQEGRARLYLYDVIAADGMEHPVFGLDTRRAIRFARADAAIAYRERLTAMRYDPHIEGC